MKYNENLYRKEKHWKEGEFDVYRNMQWTGPGCHEGCGVLFYVKDGKVDHIEGDPNDEFSRGRLCMRCLNMVDEAINNPTRLGHPLKRVGKRGENKWEQISWDEYVLRIQYQCEFLYLLHMAKIREGKWQRNAEWGRESPIENQGETCQIIGSLHQSEGPSVGLAEKLSFCDTRNSRSSMRALGRPFLSSLHHPSI